MRPLLKVLATFAMVVLACSTTYAAGVTGTVKGPDGAAFRGAFVQAVNTKTKVTVSVLSDKNGRYQVEDLPPGDYELRIKAVGFRTDPKTGVSLAALLRGHGSQHLARIRWILQVRNRVTCYGMPHAKFYRQHNDLVFREIVFGKLHASIENCYEMLACQLFRLPIRTVAFQAE